MVVQKLLNCLSYMGIVLAFLRGEVICAFDDTRIGDFVHCCEQLSQFLEGGSSAD